MVGNGMQIDKVGVLVKHIFFLFVIYLFVPSGVILTPKTVWRLKNNFNTTLVAISGRFQKHRCAFYE